MHAAQIVQLVYTPWTETIKSYANFLDLREGGLNGVSALPTLRECISGAVPIAPSAELIEDSRIKLSEIKRLNDGNAAKLKLNPRVSTADLPPDVIVGYNSLYGDVEAMTAELTKYLTALESHL